MPWVGGGEVGEMQNDSSNRVSRDDLAIERGAQFWRSLLRCVIDVMQTEAIGVAVGPLKVVHQTPEKIALHWYAVSGRSLELR